MKRAASISVTLLLIGTSLAPNGYSQVKNMATTTQHTPMEWNLAAMNKADTPGIIREGNPRTVELAGRSAVQFDGVSDGLFLDYSPLAGLSQFTVEVIFWPDGKAPHEQRFLHMGQPQGERMLLETRVTDDDLWYLDAFIRSGDSSRPLIDKNKTHPTRAWYHVALVVDNGIMDAYVNGINELSGKVSFAPLQGGQTSIGVRMNKVSWFKGAISTIRITPRCLTPKEFMK